jgi:hypothetical protein
VTSYQDLPSLVKVEESHSSFERIMKVPLMWTIHISLLPWLKTYYA